MYACYPIILSSLIADPGVVISILARSHTFVEIDHELFSYDQSPPQLEAKVFALSTGNLVQEILWLG